MKRLDFVTFLKGFSIFGIVLFHYFQYLNLSPAINTAISIGGAGIHLFFLLSGFGLYISFVNKPIDFLSFIKRRLGKIYIPYITVVLVTAAISLFIPIFTFSWNALLGHIFLYKMFDSALDVSFGFHLWFVSTIIQFYFIFHLLVAIKHRIGNNWFLVFGFAVSLSWTILMVLLGKESLRSWNSAMFQYLWEFALGMVIADWHRSEKLKLSIGRWSIAMISLISLIVYAIMALKLGQIGKVFNDYPILLAYSGIALLIYELNIKFVNRLFMFTGEIAFSFYLLHFLILVLFKQLALLTGLPPISVVVFSLIVTYVVSVYYNRMINRFYKVIGL